MFRDRDGFLRCPDDASGLDSSSLDAANAAGEKRARRRGNRDAGVFVDDAPSDAEVAANIAALEARFGVDL